MILSRGSCVMRAFRVSLVGKCTARVSWFWQAPHSLSGSIKSFARAPRSCPSFAQFSIATPATASHRVWRVMRTVEGNAQSEGGKRNT